MPETTSPTWTKHTFKCTSCGQQCYVSQEALDYARESQGYDASVTDASIAEGFDFCLKCVDGKIVPGEKVAPQPPDEWERGPIWSLNSLTPEDVRNLDAAADFLLDAPEEWGDTESTVKKIRALVGAVRSRGVWPTAKT